MPNQAVTLLLVAKTEKGWRRMPVPFGRNGKIRPQYALVDGVPVHFPGSYYALRHFEGAKTIWTTVGENATDALAARDREQHLRQAKKLAVKAGVTIVEKDEVSHTLGSLKKKWLQKLEARGKRRAIETRTIAIDDSLAMTGHTYPDFVVRTLGEVFRLKHVQGTNFSAALAMPYLGGAFNSCLPLLGRRSLVLLPTLYSVLLDRASDRNHLLVYKIAVIGW
jgi:hypothetical protein